MKRDLLIQMRNEWRDNVWLVLALTIVGCAVMLFGIKTEFALRGLFYPNGFSADNVVRMSVWAIRPNSPYYNTPDGDEDNINNHDLFDIIARLRQNKNVESVAFGWNALPYNADQIVEPIYLAEDENDSIGYYSCVRIVSPDMAKVLNLKSLTGKSTDEIYALLKRGEVLVSNIPNKLSDYSGLQPEDLYGKSILWDGREYKVGDIVEAVRGSDYDLSYGGVTIVPVAEGENNIAMEIPVWRVATVAVRVKPGCMKNFMADFEADEGLREQRNIYLTDVVTLTEAGEAYQLLTASGVRLRIMVIISMVVIVCLGILGVFWFRVHQRTKEIAIRKVCGASGKDILRRIIGEGMILLACSSILTAIVMWIYLKATYLDELSVQTIRTYIVIELLAAVFIAIGIIVSVWYPARIAMNIQPAIAIKEE